MNNPETNRLGALPSASGVLTRLAYARAHAGELDPLPLLKKANLTLREIEDPAVRLKVRDQIKFLNLVATALGDNLLGFHLAKPQDLREVGLLYYVSASSEKLSDALQKVARYTSITNESVCLKYLDDRRTGLNFSYVGVSRHLDRHQIEFSMTLLVRLCRQLTGLSLLPTSVKIAHLQDGDCSDLMKFFGGEVEFGATVDEISFAPSVKDAPVISADYHLNKLLTGYCEEALARRAPHRGSLRSEVENAIVPLLPHGKASIAEIARRLGVSQRTLARRLSSENLTYSDVMEKLKVDLAERYLADKDLSISKIAWLLGYQEVSSLTHAYKRWTGKTPKLARSQAAA